MKASLLYLDPHNTIFNLLRRKLKPETRILGFDKVEIRLTISPSTPSSVVDIELF